MSKYIVVCRAQSGVRFGKNDPLFLSQFPTRFGRADIVIKTRLTQLSGFSKPVPMGLMAEVCGEGPSMDEALQEFSRTVQSICPVFVLIGNSPIEDMTPELGYDASTEVTEREYFQQMLPEEALLIVERRRIASKLALSVLRAMLEHPDSERMRRAAGQYYQAMRNWEPGQKTLALAHIWMGIEALTPVALKRVLSEEGLDRSGVIAKWQVDAKSLDAEVRKRVLMRGDEESYRLAKAASDGFEHGYLGFDEIFAHADVVRDKAAHYLRAAIIELLDLEASDAAVLTSDLYAKPGHLHVARYLRGLLVGSGESLAAEGKAHPFIEWRTNYLEVENPSPDEVSFRMEEAITPRLAPGIGFKPQRLEVWGGQNSTFISQAP